MTSIQGQQELEQRGRTGMNQSWQSRNWAFHLCISFANENLKKCLFQKIQTFPTASSRRSASFCSAATLPQLQNVSTPVAQLTSFVFGAVRFWAFSIEFDNFLVKYKHGTHFAGSPTLIYLTTGGYPAQQCCNKQQINSALIGQVQTSTTKSGPRYCWKAGPRSLFRSLPPWTTFLTWSAQSSISEQQRNVSKTPSFS